MTTDSIVNRLTNQAYQQYRQAPASAYLYLYYRPSSGAKCGDLVAAEDAPTDDYQLVGSRLDPSWPDTKIATYIRQIVNRLPILPTE